MPKPVRAAPERVTVGVLPRPALEGRARLFQALEGALPVRFEARAPGEVEGLAAAVVVGEPGELPAGLPVLVLGEGAGGEGAAMVELSATPGAVDRRLRGQVLGERHPAWARPQARPGDEVLARAAGRPVWLRRRGEAGGAVVELATAPGELGPDEPLRARLAPGRFMGLLPLLHFLRRVSAPVAWAPPPPRACLIFDDPNLHWRSYGHLHFERLARHAADWAYHVALATVPIDGWFAHPAALRLLRGPEPRLSLTVHGNNHERLELASPRPEAELLAMLAQAGRRAARFERRTGVAVDRVMVPPHGVCARATVETLGRAGFDAVTANEPFPWHSDAATGRALVGWHPADLVAGGLPVLLRQHLSYDREELVFRALLDQPLVVYGHHEDVAGGLDELAAVATQVNRLGAVRWGPLGALGRAGYAARRDGAMLLVRPYARSLRVEVPEGVLRVQVERPAALGPGEPLAVATTGEPCRLDLSLDEVDLAGVASPPWRPWPIVRRLLTEARDRARPRLAPARPAGRVVALADAPEAAPAETAVERSRVAP